MRGVYDRTSWQVTGQRRGVSIARRYKSRESAHRAAGQYRSWGWRGVRVAMLGYWSE